jgi:hypothetical protein
MELGGWVVSPTETELGYEALKDALGMITAQDFSYSPPLQVVERFKSSENGMLFVKVIRQMTRDTF